MHCRTLRSTLRLFLPAEYIVVIAFEEECGKDAGCVAGGGKYIDRSAAGRRDGDIHFGSRACGGRSVNGNRGGDYADGLGAGEIGGQDEVVVVFLYGLHRVYGSCLGCSLFVTAVVVGRNGGGIGREDFGREFCGLSR